MAKGEKDEKVPKAEKVDKGDKGKILILVIAVLVVVSIILSTISIIQISTISKALKPSGTDTIVEEEDMGMIPITKTMNHKMAESIIVILPYQAEEETRMLNVSMSVAFRILKDDSKKGLEATAALDLQITDNEGILNDRITKLLKTKYAEELDGETADLAKIQNEIKDLANTLFDTDKIVDVYFDPILTSPR